MTSLLEAAQGTAPLIESDPKADGKNKYWGALRSKLEQKLQSMDTNRLSWWAHWAELAKYILPRRYHWLIVANRSNRGSPINQNIVDATGTIAARTLSSALLSGLSSPTNDWIHFVVPDEKLMLIKRVKMWLEDVKRVMNFIMSTSNFYGALATMYFDLVVFGTAVVIIYEDKKKIIHCYNPCAGEYYLALNAKLLVDTMGRKFTYTIDQIVQMFGEDNVSESVLQMYKTGGASGQTEKIIAHIIEPNAPIQGDTKDEMVYPVPKKFAFRETYWEWGSSDAKPLALRGFNETPFIAPRWDVCGNDPYGRSPCMDALPDIMQLQFETKRKAEGIAKEVNPPMLADVSLKNEPTSSVAGGITYVSNIGKTEGMKPVFQVSPKLDNLMNDLKEIQARIKTILFNDLILMISQLTTVRTAAEIDARREEKMLALGPVIERNEDEGLDVAIERIFGIAQRRGMFPPAPPEIRNMPLQVNYVSMFTQAQRATDTAAIERVFQFTGNIGGVIPDAFDNIDIDRGIEIYADRLNVPAEIIRDMSQITKMRTDRAQKQEQQDNLNQSLAAAKGAQNLSKTDVGGGINALQLMAGAGG